MNWQTKKLGEICEILIGGTPSRGVLEYWKNGTLSWVSIRDMSREGDIIENTNEKITEKGAKESNVKLIPKGSLLFSFKLSIGKLAIAGSDLYTNEAIAALAIKDEDQLDKSFLRHYISQMVFNDVTTAVKGSTLNKEKIKNLEIPLPPLKIQKEIVSKLDAKFVKLREVKRLREEVLTDTEKTLSQALCEIFEQGKQKGWEEKELQRVCEIARGGSPRPIQNYLTDSDDGVNWIKISDATSSGKYIYKTKQKIIKDGLHKTRMVYPGDFILTNSMSFGRPYIVKTEGAIHDGWLLLRPDKSISQEYLYYFLSSNDVYRQFKNLAGGAVVQNLNSSLIKNIKVLIPAITEQQKIVTRLDGLSEKIKSLRELQISQLADLKRLEKAYLREAFNGTLE